MNVALFHKTEILPSQHPLTGDQRDAGHAAALAELHEVRELLRTPSQALTSPRIRRRYNEALTALATYQETYND